jgi:hypothetical protein
MPNDDCQWASELRQSQGRNLTDAPERRLQAAARLKIPKLPRKRGVPAGCPAVVGACAKLRPSLNRLWQHQPICSKLSKCFGQLLRLPLNMTISEGKISSGFVQVTSPCQYAVSRIDQARIQGFSVHPQITVAENDHLHGIICGRVKI